ncbi:MAG TPA: type I-F CRISPR-associated endoribonuclease Cas6/Csy4, partial [Agitococcus sp.]|nr:type I-F CRISPR-associated endoribonuclease Cas6/Csy4 [Agitococcus sp.]
MKYYIELTLMDNPDFNLYTLWSKLYTQLHLAFVEQKDSQEKIAYGVSFPRYRLSQDKGVGFLGDKLRIFAHSTQELEQLNLNQWLARLSDYVHITAPRETPHNVSHAIYSRVVPKDSVEKRILHQAQRRNI